MNRLSGKRPPFPRKRTSCTPVRWRRVDNDADANGRSVGADMAQHSRATQQGAAFTFVYARAVPPPLRPAAPFRPTHDEMHG